MTILTAIPRDIVSLSDYERYARARLDDNAWVYLMSGAGDELTVTDNAQAYQRIKLAGHVLGDVAGGHTRLELLGQALPHPICVAPMAYHKLFHPDGEAATAMGAGAVGAGMVISSLASVSFEEIAAKATGPLWLQLYLQPDRGAVLEMVRRAEALGFAGLMVTVDAPLAGLRNREQRAGFTLPDRVRAVNVTSPPVTLPPLSAGQSVVFDGLMAQAPTWADMEWLTGQTYLPVMLKGILTPTDAVRAFEVGAAGVVISNHGGRILDGLPATIDVLPAIVYAAQGRGPVLIDGGIRRGSDIFKALALGASAVMIGRPVMHALATAGALGVAHAIRTLHEELEVVMALSGCATLKDISRTHLITA
ncbi:alpha-hydroxy acid oxidase [Asticcacaulis endophyticus]|uniref:Alpha-hydroxy-acid oxidizing enzyme n=1 Tax=Asticcacaulis endophyticus TaxID=1395890 RepID=A0A918PXH9_9CAUL|nr:alpha-hydroxy acid oxidase [Asticcacaulis endophyticus]GGZ26562.1 alpha-hydroxy-acid oxidizing enzyme [Asticcacaulis endophyticus]